MERKDGVRISNEVYRELLHGTKPGIPESSYITRFLELANEEVRKDLMESVRYDYGGNTEFLYLLSGVLLSIGPTPEMAANEINMSERVYAEVKNTAEYAWRNKIKLGNFDLYLLTQKEAEELGIERPIAVIRHGNSYFVPVEKLDESGYWCVNLSNLREGAVIRLKDNKISIEKAEAPKFYNKDITISQESFIHEFYENLSRSFAREEQFPDLPPERKMLKEESRGRNRILDPAEHAILKGEHQKVKELLEGYDKPVDFSELWDDEESGHQ